jgi:hypothetical protein
MYLQPEQYEEYPGASHCDELAYFFKTSLPISLPSPTLDSMLAIDSLKLPFDCMNISNDGAEMMPLPEGASLKVWDEVFESENVELC